MEIKLNPIMEGLLKAIKFIAAGRQTPIKQKRIITEEGGYLILKTSRTQLTPEQVAFVDAGQVDKIPSKFVALHKAKREHIIDRSKYTGLDLREIRASPDRQKRECARRLMRMNANARA